MSLLNKCGFAKQVQLLENPCTVESLEEFLILIIQSKRNVSSCKCSENFHAACCNKEHVMLLSNYGVKNRVLSQFSEYLPTSGTCSPIAVITDVSGLTCKRGKRVNLALYWLISLICRLNYQPLFGKMSQ